MRSRHRVTPQRDSASVDLTPMMDVVFILLIFFIVTASFAKEAGLDVARQNARTASRPDAAAILVEISETDRVSVAGLETDVRRVGARIEAELSIRPGAGVVIRPSSVASNGAFVRVLDAARRSSAPSVVLVPGD